VERRVYRHARGCRLPATMTTILTPEPEGRPDPAHTPYVMSVQQKLYLWLTGFFVACLLVSDVVGVKLFQIGPVKHTCGMLTFPVTFLLTDLINEYYGKKGARRVTWIGFVMGWFVFLVINIALSMPYLDAPYNIRRDSFEAVFAASRVMFMASMVAFLVGQFCDIWVFHLLKKLTRGRMLGLRATGSTIVSQMIDSFVVSYLAFGLGRQVFPSPGTPPAPFGEILGIAATGYILKFCVAVGITPLIYLGHGLMHRWFGLVPLPAQDTRA
jgi:queuosine precursor transporter